MATGYHSIRNSYGDSLQRRSEARYSETYNNSTSRYTSLPQQQPTTYHPDPQRGLHMNQPLQSAIRYEHRPSQSWPLPSASNPASGFGGRQDPVTHHQNGGFQARGNSSSTRITIDQVLSESNRNGFSDRGPSPTSYLHPLLEPGRAARAILPLPDMVSAGRSGATGDLNSYTSRNSYHEGLTSVPPSVRHEQGLPTGNHYQSAPTNTRNNISAEDAERRTGAEEHTRRPM